MDLTRVEAAAIEATEEFRDLIEAAIPSAQNRRPRLDRLRVALLETAEVAYLQMLQIQDQPEASPLQKAAAENHFAVMSEKALRAGGMWEDKPSTNIVIDNSRSELTNDELDRRIAEAIAQVASVASAGRTETPNVNGETH